MTLLEYHDLFFKSLKSKIDTNELGEFFFWIIDHTLGINRINYMLNPQYLININKIPSLKNSINQLKNDMPIQYVVGQTEFMGMKYFLGKNKKIPMLLPAIFAIAWIILGFNVGSHLKNNNMKYLGLLATILVLISMMGILPFQRKHNIIDGPGMPLFVIAWAVIILVNSAK